jgi:hypothetical protein
MSSSKLFQHKPSKQTRENLHGEKEVGSAGDPASVGVLTYWKMSAVYCRAVLDHDQRITLDGTPVEAVDDVAKDLATKQLIRLALWERREADLARQGKAGALPEACASGGAR